jgi:archaellum biogenesis protein FlaJ (TadC family)
MAPLATWEMLLIGALVVLLLFWFRPGLKASLEESRKTTRQDWMNLLFPIGLVVLFVLLLIMMVSR